MNQITLDRMGSTPWGTFGTLRLPDGAAFQTVEPHWEHNAKGKSCIPAGQYDMAMRNSLMVARTSGQAYRRGWEVQAVPGRSLIMIHPGNWESDSDGCILVGRAHAVIKGKPGITASRAAFADLMTRLAKQDAWQILIRWNNPES